MQTGIALGSNLGNRLNNLRNAINRIEALIQGDRAPRRSRIYETDPVDCSPEAPAYLNAVIEIDYKGHPLLLLESLQNIEKEMGRPSKRPRNASRIIDLDILYVGNLTLSNEEIRIPHPRIHSRRFVLTPLADIQPDLILPGYQENVSQMLKKLPEHPSVRLFSETWN